MLWYDTEGRLVEDGVETSVTMLADGKRYNTTSVLNLSPTRFMHNKSLTCSASNTADRSRR